MKTPRILLFILAFTGWLVCTALAQNETETTQEIADRYELLLLRSPQAGAAFDRVVEWYATKGGGLEALQARWKTAAEKDANARPAYFLLQGLLAERLRTPDQARAFYQQALKEGDAVQAAKLLAVLETTEGNFAEAAQAYQKALAAESLAPVDRMELMRSLALLHQRNFDDAKALAVWQDALKRFPDDPYVLEEAGEAFIAAGNYEEARKAFTSLREKAEKDPFRRVAASLRLARTAELEGKTEEAVRIYELALEDTSEGSWINREVRSRIEELFRRKDDLPGLLSYYEKRSVAVPQDYQALAAQGAVLEDLGRGTEAIDRYRSATKLAPDNVELRLTLIRSLTTIGQTDAAITEAEDLTKKPTAPPEALIVLGDLQWEKFKKTKEEKDKQAAVSAWKRIAPDETTDVGSITRLADILASHELTDDAMTQWQRVITLTPSAADARQRMADVYVKRGDKAAAEKILAELIAGDRAVPENFLTLARIQDRMTWSEAARATTGKGLELFPKDYDLLTLAWRQAEEAADEKAVSALFPQLWKNAPNAFFAEDAAKRYASFIGGLKNADELTAAMTKRIEDGSAEPADAIVLFRLAIANQDEATTRKALKALEKSETALALARANFEFAQTFGSPEEQISALQTVAQADSRMAVDSLRMVARLQAETGKADAALATVADLISRSPADSGLYNLYSDIATQAGKYDLAVTRLREALRYVEDASTLRLQLADLLTLQGKNADADAMLKEAFEKETKDTRRMDIFRRQVELANQSGTISDLIASLREKQSREQGGARYGAYLAEIFMMQGDFVSAGEELSRSLGRNPDNAAAVSRLLDLADRSGDTDESLRLAARLAELEPSQENQSSYLARLFDSGQIEDARAQFLRLRPEILKDPNGWSTALLSMRKAGLDQECDDLIAEIASGKAAGVEQLTELARLRMLQRNFAEAEKNLWAALETGNLAESLDAVANSGPKTGFGMMPGPWIYLQPFQQLSAEVQNSMQMAFQPYRGGGFFRSARMFGMPMAMTSGQIAPEQKEQVRALFTLSFLERANRDSEEFSKRLRKLMVERQVPARLQLLTMMALNDQEGAAEFAKAYAELETADPELDRLLLSAPIASADGAQKIQEKIRARLEKSDPQFAFEQLLSKVSSEMSSVDPEKLDDKKRVELRTRLEELLANPAIADKPLSKAQLGSLAARIGEFPQAFRLVDEAAADPSAGGAGYPAMQFKAQIISSKVAVLNQAILQGYAEAPAEFEKMLAGDTFKAAGASGVFFSGGYRIMGSGMGNPLIQGNPDLVIGDAAFPVQAYRMISQLPPDSTQGKKLAEWFAQRATGNEITPYVMGTFYGEWFGNKKEEATKRIEAIHAKNPTPRSAAILLEIYEKSNSTDKALAVIDLAALQDGETRDVRDLRRLRILKTAGKVEEARAIAEQLARTRLSTGVREQLAGELNVLGIPPTKYPALTASNMRRSRSRDSGDMIREQLSKLVQEKKTDEAERIAMGILQRPMPRRDDYQQMNLRQNMIGSLRSMKRLEAAQNTLVDRLTKDPGDVDAAIRLAELSSGEDFTAAADRMAETITAHPDRITNIDYALQLLERNGDSRASSVKILCELLKNNPAILSKGGYQIENLMNLASQADSGPLLAETIASLDDKAFDTLMLPSRLMQSGAENMFLSQLAEFAIQANKPDQAIALLRRAIGGVQVNLDMAMPASIRLAELLLAQNKKDEATAVMKDLIEKPSRGNIYSGGQTLSNVLLNMMMNRSPGNPTTGMIVQVAKVAEATGTLDLLLKTLDEQNKGIKGSLSASLLLRTMLDRPEIAQEWRDIALSQTPFTGYLTLPMLSTVMKSLAEQKDGLKLITSLLKKIPENQYSMGADMMLGSLVDTLPVLTKYKDDPSIKRYMQMLVNKAMQDPNGGRYLPHSENYQSALIALADAGYMEDARKLFEYTAAERANRNFGQMFRGIEARLSDSGGPQGAAIALAGEPLAADRLKVYWNIAPAAIDESEDDDGAPPVPATWSENPAAVSKEARPQELEIFAGPNPCAMTSVARKSKPEQIGSVEAKVTAPYGLLQARWKTADGTVRWGPLTAYLTGENLVVKQGIPEQTPGSTSANAYKTGLPGPWGPQSAVRYEAMAPRPDPKIPLATVALNSTPQLLAFSGWFKTIGRYGNSPMIEIRTKRLNGRNSENNVGSRVNVPGQWVQIFALWSVGESMSNVMSLDRDTLEARFAIGLNATSGYNSQYAINGSWDGVQIVKLPLPPNATDRDKFMRDAQDLINKKDFAKAAETYLTAIQTDPYNILQGSVSQLVDTFIKAGALGKLYTALSSPALYMPNPLRENQPTLRNSTLIERLTREALAPGAPAEASAWLRQLEGAPLRDDQRYAVQSALLQEKSNRDASKVSTKEILALLGFSEKTVNIDRVRQIWSGGNESRPTLELLKLIKTPEQAREALALVKQAQIQVAQMSAQQMLQAWLIAPEDPNAALDLWRQSLSLRHSGQNNANFSDDADRAMVTRIANGPVDQGKLIAELKNWIGRNNSDPLSQQTRLAEILYGFAQASEAGGEKFSALWADTELAALRTPGYSPSRDRIRELAHRLMEAQEWDRFDNLLSATKTNQALQSSSLQREFTQLADMAALKRGDISKAWPISWYKPGATDKDITVCWQWNIKDMPEDGSKFDTVVTVAEKPVLPEIKNQTEIEVLFGEMPGDLKSVGKTASNSGEGNVSVKLPTANGFLRVVATVGDKRVAGPLTAVMHGKRIYPPGNTSLLDLLGSGSEPISPKILTAAGTAPDGSPAVRIGQKGSRDRMNFAGPEFSISSGKFYVSRAWIRRAGNGTASAGSLYKALKTTARNTLNMILSESQGSTGQWVFYNRAVPALDSHTFWIPVDEVEFIVPLLSQIDPGTEVAGWDFLEISDWKYAAWIVELANIRKNTGTSGDAKAIARALELAALEPLTALDYHGDWLVSQSARTGQTDQLAGLFRTALAAEPNPLFARPKTGRVFAAINTAINSEVIPAAQRWDIVQIGIENMKRARPSYQVGFQTKALQLAPTPELRAEALKKTRENFTASLQNKETGESFLRAIVSIRDSRNDRAWNEMLALVLTLDDPEFTRMCLEKINKKDTQAESSDKIFAALALEACLPDAKPDASWKERVRRGFIATERASTANAYMCWPSVLADLLEQKKLAPEVQLEIYQNALKRLASARENDQTVPGETIRAAAALLAIATNQKSAEVAATANEKLLATIKDNSGKLSEENLRTLLRTLDSLSASGDTSSVSAIVTAAEPDIRKSPQMVESYSRYLSAGSATDTP